MTHSGFFEEPAPLAAVTAPFSGPSLNVDGPIVCARHARVGAEILAAAQCACGAPLCSACARSASHRRCPTCREQNGLAPHAIDAGWRADLLVDSLAQSFRGLPAAAPMMSFLALVSLGGGLLIAMQDFSQTDGIISPVAVGMGFAFLLFGLSYLVQPLICLPRPRAPSLTRRFAAALVASAGLASLGFPSFALAVAASVAGMSDDTTLALLTGSMLVFLIVLPPLLLVAQAQIVAGWRISLRRVLGTLFAASIMMFATPVLLSALAPVIFVVTAIGLVNHIAGGIVAVVVGLAAVALVLFVQGAFAAGTARYVEDVRQFS